MKPPLLLVTNQLTFFYLKQQISIYGSNSLDEWNFLLYLAKFCFFFSNEQSSPIEISGWLTIGSSKVSIWDCKIVDLGLYFWVCKRVDLGLYVSWFGTVKWSIWDCKMISFGTVKWSIWNCKMISFWTVKWSIWDYKICYLSKKLKFIDQLFY